MDALIFALIVALCAICTEISAFKIGSSKLHLSRTASRQLEMKGKIPVQLRKDIERKQQMAESVRDYKRNRRTDIPYLQLYVRPKGGGPWTPFAEFPGDQRATAIVNAISAGFAKEFYKTQLDRAVARSLFSPQMDVYNAARNAAPVFRTFKDDRMVFGYKIDWEVQKEKLTGFTGITVIDENTDKSNKTWFENIGESIQALFKPNDGTEDIKLIEEEGKSETK